MLLCTYHHHLVHRRELTITRLPRGSTAPPSREHHLRARYRFTDREGGTITDLTGRESPPVTDLTEGEGRRVTDLIDREGRPLPDRRSPAAATGPPVVDSAVRQRLAAQGVRRPTAGPTLWELSAR